MTKKFAMFAVAKDSSLAVFEAYLAEMKFAFENVGGDLGTLRLDSVKPGDVDRYPAPSLEFLFFGETVA